MLTAAFAIAALAPVAGPAAQPQTSEATASAPDAEDETEPKSLELEIAYTGEVMSNIHGGRRRRIQYLDNLDIIVAADMERMIGWPGAKIQVYGLYNNGQSISDFVGDAQAISNIETGTRALRLFEAWVDQEIGKRTSLRLGLYDLNSEFDALETAGLFTGSANGIGTDIAQSGRNGPSIFPSTSLGVRLQVEPADGWIVRAVILDGIPGDPARPGKTAIHLGHGDGALLVGELKMPLLAGKALLGHWRYTGNFDRNDGSGSARGNSGTYVRTEIPLFTRRAASAGAFMRLGIASGRFNMFDRFAAGGVTVTGLFPRRESDQLGLSASAAFTSDSFRTANGSTKNEVAFELTYRAELAPWVAVQPSIHYIRHPGADPTIRKALAIGLRTEFRLRLRSF